MAGKSRRPVPSVPYADALAWCGESALRASSTPQMRTNWKDAERGGVPWYIVGPIIKRQLDEARSLPPIAPTAPNKPHEVSVANKVDLVQAQVARLFFQRRPDAWTSLINLLNGFVPPEDIVRNPDLLPEPPAPQEPHQQRKKRRGGQ